MDYARRRLAGLRRIGHCRAEDKMMATEIAARLGLGDGKRRQCLQNERIDEQDAHHVPRQIPEPLPPTGASHGLPAGPIRQNT